MNEWMDWMDGWMNEPLVLSTASLATQRWMMTVSQQVAPLTLPRDKWMNEWINEWMDEWMNEWINEWMTEWMSEWIN